MRAPLWILLVATVALPAAAAPSSDPAPLATTRLVTTEDGATIALHHHPGVGTPVLMVHGISSNHRFFDLDAEHSMADWLVAKGWDVWMLDLRGHGDAVFGKDTRRQMTGWTVDDYGRYDVPAAVDWIQRVTHHDQLAYVGHSMGGMVLAVYLQTHPDAPLSSVTLLGSPGAFTKSDPNNKLASAGFGAGSALTVYVDAPVFGDLAATLGAWSPGRLHEKLYNPKNLDKSTQLALLRSVVSPLSRKEMAHFGKMMRSGRFTSFDEETDWGAGMAQNTVPTLLVQGTADQVVVPANVQAYYDQLGGEKKLFQAEGYGHLDLGLGEAAETEIFPVVDAWMREHPAR